MTWEVPPQPWTAEPWSPYGVKFDNTVYEVDFIVPEGNFFQVDPLSNEGFLVPEPSTCLLLLFGMLGMVGMKKKAWIR